MRFGTFLFVLLSPLMLHASEGAMPMRRAHVDVTDTAALQRGAKIYMNYCSGCHSLKYVRYSQMAKGLGLLTFDGRLDRDLLFNNLVFTKADDGDPIVIAMPPADAREWFGKIPPDLSLEARVRGVDWLFTYLTSFYQDDNKPFNSNNRLFPDVAMPNVLAPLQGNQVAVYKEKTFMFGDEKKTEKVISHLQIVKEGEMTEHQFDSAVNDLVTFLSYVGEPMQTERQHIGYGVLLFLLVLAGLTYALKKAFWSQLKPK